VSPLCPLPCAIGARQRQSSGRERFSSGCRRRPTARRSPHPDTIEAVDAGPRDYIPALTFFLLDRPHDPTARPTLADRPRRGARHGDRPRALGRAHARPAPPRPRPLVRRGSVGTEHAGRPASEDATVPIVPADQLLIVDRGAVRRCAQGAGYAHAGGDAGRAHRAPRGGPPPDARRLPRRGRRPPHRRRHRRPSRLPRCRPGDALPRGRRARRPLPAGRRAPLLPHAGGAGAAVLERAQGVARAGGISGAQDGR
jgi:hypothetical protein